MSTSTVSNPSAGPRQRTRPGPLLVAIVAGLLGCLIGALLLAPAGQRLVPTDAEQSEVAAFLADWDAALRSRDMAEVQALAMPDASFYGREIGSTAAGTTLSLGWAPGQEVTGGEPILTRGDPVIVHVARVVTRQGLENLETLRLERTEDGLRVASVDATTLPV